MQTPTSWDAPNPQKSMTLSYDPAVLLGTISASGSLSSAFDLSGWTNFALKLDPNGGTFLGGTVVNIFAAPSLQDTFTQVYGTSGATALQYQIGSTGIQILSALSQLAPLRFVKFGLGGTQDASRTLTLFVK